MTILVSLTVTAQYELGVSSGLFVPNYFEKAAGEKASVSTFISLQGQKGINKYLTFGLSTELYQLSMDRLTNNGNNTELYRSNRSFSLSLSPYILLNKNIGKGRLSAGLGYSAVLALKQQQTEIHRYVESDVVISHTELRNNSNFFNNSINFKLDYRFGFGLFVGYEFRYNIAPFREYDNRNLGLNFIKVGYLFRIK